jgi:hypothetical protein
VVRKQYGKEPRESDFVADQAKGNEINGTQENPDCFFLKGDIFL